MLKTIIIREIQEYIKSKKFLIGLLITLFLVTVTTWINIEDYARRQQDYLDAKREMGKENVFRPPQVLSIFAVGKDQKLGNRAEISKGSVDVTTTGYMGKFESMHQKYLSGFSGIDYAFVIRVVLSMIVMFFAYNAISGEKENGTLKLMLTNNLPRSHVLIGKSAGGLIVVILPLLIASFVSILIIIMFHPAINLNADDWILLIGMFLVSALYLTAFYTLSLLISVNIKSPSTCIMVLVQLWIFLVIIYPNASVFIADKSYRLPSEIEIQREKRQVSQSYIDLGNKLFSDYSEKNPDYKKWDFNDPVLIKRNEAYNKATELEYQVKRKYGNQLRWQAELAEKIGLLSPAVVYDKVMLHYARTDIDEYESFLDGLFINWKTYRQFTDNSLEYRERMKNMPEFSYQSQTVPERIKATLDEILILFLFSVLFFSLAYTSFLKKDVR